MTTTYLCGGINGLNDADCRDWREVAKELLQTETLDPMRRDYRGKEDSSVNEIVAGDLLDIAASDFVLVNATRPSWGTAMEIVYARQRGKRVVCWTGDARISPWLRYHSEALYTTIDLATDHINASAKRVAQDFPRDPSTGRAFDGHYDHRFDCGCIDFYHGGVGRCAQHS